MQDPVIEIYNLSKLFGIGDATNVALDDITLRIERGEFVCIMGPSGSGKSTLMNILGLLDSPTTGEYYLEAKQVAKLGHHRRARLRRDKIGMIFQHFNLLNRATVIDNVMLPLTYKGFFQTKRLKQASAILETFGLHEREYYLPHQLSGGQLQRVAIARALVTKPAILLADEPTGNLDSKSSNIIMQELAEIHRQGNTIIMVTHNPEIAMYADRMIQMLDGKIAHDTSIPGSGPTDPTKKRALSAYRKIAEAVAAKSKEKERLKKLATRKKAAVKRKGHR
ncbi:MAG TPA: ABC transporter ATP-binding protein [Candidatus Acidoferrum sp.]|nr:ABC transporter ATP-binding protein [Candidatus Acidoferrum sp.]